MPLTQDWYTIEEAESTYGVHVLKLQQWAESGAVRTQNNDGVIMFNGYDIEQELVKVSSG